MTTALASHFLPSGSVVSSADPRWHEHRSRGVGASESASFFRCGWASPAELYYRKVGALGPLEETRAMRIGRLLEPAVAALYMEETGHGLASQQVLTYRPGRPRTFATLDAVRDDGRIVEFKVVGSHAARDWREGDDIPAVYLLQLQHQMLAAGAGEADIAALIGTDFQIRTIPRDEAIVGAIRSRVDWFLGCLDAASPPPPTEPGDAALRAFAHPEAAGEVDLVGEMDRAAVRYLELAASGAAREKERKILKATIEAGTGGAALLRLQDGRLLARRVQANPERTQVVKASTFSVLAERKRKEDRDGDE